MYTIIGHGPFSVKVNLRGSLRGEYRHPTRKKAEEDAKNNRDRFSVLGFTYRVVSNK